MQQNILKYLLQDDKAKNIVQHLDEKIFDEVIDKAIFIEIHKYYKKYNTNPNKDNFLYFIQKHNNIDPESWKILTDRISRYYYPIRDTEIVQERIVDYAKRKLIKQLFIDNIGRIDSSDETIFSNIYKEVNKITNIDIGENYEILDFDDRKPRSIEDSISHPTFLQQLNSMTNVGGFKKPELISFLAGPKCFKTGILLNIAYHYRLAGLNVFYADFENGAQQLMDRLDQRMMNMQSNEVIYNEALSKQIRTKQKITGAGSIKIVKFRARKDSLNEVESVLDKLKIDGWEPDVIFYDYLDLANAPGEPDRRNKIQFNYHQAITINNERNTFCFTISKMKQEGFNKEFASISDFGEDSEKAYNCHASFYISRTQDDMQEGTARIFPLVQRQGISFSREIFCPIKLDESVQYIEEMFRQ